MRNVGIVRRLDALGRIVIPREYRKMHRIELGDPLEIIALDNGEIVLRKVDLTAELIGFGQFVADAASRQLNKTVLIASKKAFAAGSGHNKSAFLGMEIPMQLAKAIALRKELVGKGTDFGFGESETTFACACPILGSTDCFGAVVMLSSVPVSEDELRLIRALTSVAGNNLEKY